MNSFLIWASMGKLYVDAKFVPPFGYHLVTQLFRPKRLHYQGWEAERNALRVSVYKKNLQKWLRPQKCLQFSKNNQIVYKYA